MEEKSQTTKSSGSGSGEKAIEEAWKRKLLQHVLEAERPLDELMTEEEVLKLTGWKKRYLDVLRQKHRMPYCPVTTQKRFYAARDVARFILEKRVILNQVDV